MCPVIKVTTYAFKRKRKLNDTDYRHVVDVVRTKIPMKIPILFVNMSMT